MLSIAWRISKLWAETPCLKLPSIGKIQYCTTYYFLILSTVKSCKECKGSLPSSQVNRHYIFFLQHSQLSLMAPAGFFVVVVTVAATKWMLLKGCNGCSSVLFHPHSVPELPCTFLHFSDSWIQWALSSLDEIFFHYPKQRIYQM